MQLDQQLLGCFLVFCRVGACLMIVPGFSNARVPMRIRLYLALAIAVVIEPVTVRGNVGPMSDSGLIVAILAECLAGLIIGGVARIFMEAIDFTGAAIANYIGLSGLAAGFDSGEPEPALATLITATSTLLLVLMDFPLVLISTIADSYTEIPNGVIPDMSSMLRLHVGSLASAFLLGLQISAPFLVYGLVVNVMFGILGKLVPQMPTFFISVPFIAFGGILLLYMVSGQLMQLLRIGLTGAIGR